MSGLKYYRSQLAFRGISHKAPSVFGAVSLLKKRLAADAALPIHLIILDWMRELKKDGSAEKRKHAEESLLRAEQIDTAEKTARMMEEHGAASLMVKRTRLGKNEENLISYVEQKITCKHWDISGKWTLQSVNTKQLLVPATMEIRCYENPTQIFGGIDSGQFGGILRCSKGLESDYPSDASADSDSSGAYDEFDIGDNDQPTGNGPRLFFRFFGFDIKARAIVAGEQGEETCTTRFSAEGKKVETCLWYPETYYGGDV
ncbi:uncharacterized protein L3040_003766 [Drepanopeziza brunnea f. sp. 'multigermtubi']|uniref:uncharacterized protein n=1 Tax=Drepanopeziza brunnea f. sp. 'multigermtubi' TaxID=698441 RepID=UPI0023A0BFB4|nr:hypothetical protein L3040_003766 [Drepanopeziza brunnea f. sp. 'multigermtubi']